MTEFDLNALRARRDAAIDSADGELWTLTVEELKAAYKAGERDFRQADLRGANLSALDLRGVNLLNADLTSANLYMVDLRGASLIFACLRGVNLQGSDLPLVDLMWTDLKDANLSRADLRGIKIEGAYIENVNVINAVGIYSAFGFYTSAQRALYGGLVLVDRKIELRFYMGVKMGIVDDELQRMMEDYAFTSLQKDQCWAAAGFIKRCFNLDMAAGKWDYLVNWKPGVNDDPAT